MPFEIRPKQTVLFTGDSITDCGRRGEHRPFGQGYVRMIVDLIRARYPGHDCRFVNTGVGGDTVRKLFDRWTDDCVRVQPHWLSIMVGINDISRTLANSPDAVPVEEYERLYDTILGRVKTETKAKVILMTPFYMSTARPTEADGWRGLVMKTLPDYIKVVEKMSKRYGTKLVRTHDMFQRQFRHHRPDEFGAEPVHPNPSGHLLLAHEWLKTMNW